MSPDQRAEGCVGAHYVTAPKFGPRKGAIHCLEQVVHIPPLNLNLVRVTWEVGVGGPDDGVLPPWEGEEDSSIRRRSDDHGVAVTYLLPWDD